MAKIERLIKGKFMKSYMKTAKKQVNQLVKSLDNLVGDVNSITYKQLECPIKNL